SRMVWLGGHSDAGLAEVPPIVGPCVSTVQVAVRDTGVAGLPHASSTVQVRVWERVQPDSVTLPSDAFGVTSPQLSVAAAVPSAASICAAVGLQPSAPSAGVPVAVITGGSWSLNVMCCTQLTEWLQASIAIQVRSIPACPVQLAATVASEW